MDSTLSNIAPPDIRIQKNHVKRPLGIHQDVPHIIKLRSYRTALKMGDEYDTKEQQTAKWIPITFKYPTLHSSIRSHTSHGDYKNCTHKILVLVQVYLRIFFWCFTISQVCFDFDCKKRDINQTSGKLGRNWTKILNSS